MKRPLIVVCLSALLALSVVPVLAQTCNTQVPETTPWERFSISGDEVTDLATGLTWQRCPLGYSGSNCLPDGGTTSYTWTNALQAAQALAQSTGKAWRLPNLKELSSIVEERCSSPTINLSVFPGTPSSYFWSASPYANDSYYAWGVYFHYGDSYGSYKTSTRVVRLVRGGQ